MSGSTEWVVHGVNTDVAVITVCDMPPLAPGLDARVDVLWAEASRNHQLFNGRVFSIDEVTPDRIAGHWSEYRRIIAQMRDPSLRSRIGVRNLAVCGVIVGPDGVLLGRRTTAAVYQPGLWQLPPAGSVDAAAATPAGADLRKALMLELREELGLGEDAVTGFRPLCLVEHPGSGVSDLGIALSTRLTHDQIAKAHVAGGNGEYDRLVSAPVDRLLDVAQQMGGDVAPPVPRFLAALEAAGLG